MQKNSKKEILISIVVPVFGVEKYLERCVDSIRNQTYSNLEIILVDDGSRDNSPMLCDEYANIDHRIKVIHKPNGGLSSARNVGLDVATGDFVGFVDSDDWVEKDTYEYLLSLIEQNNADVAQIKYKETSTTVVKPNSKKEKVVLKTGKSILDYYMLDTTKNGSYSVCICLFKKTILQGLKFREGFINEDIDFKYKALSNCDVFVSSNLVKYYYFQADTPTISSGGLKTKDFQLYDAAEELCKLTEKETFGNIAKLGAVKKARTAYSLLAKIAMYGIADTSLNKKEIVKRLTKENRKNWKTLMKSPIGFKRKALITSFAISFGFTEFLIHILTPSIDRTQKR